jgi:phospholipase C
MDTRREFIKKAAVLAGGNGLFGALPPAIQRALAIDPKAGTTWLDAEHVVILMQENRSFDHCYGALRGVRGFRDPRFITLPNGNPVWLQSNGAGQTFAPFRLDIRGTNATWMGSLPHDWTNQSDARNGGRYDGWLEAKHSSEKEYAGMPLTLGYYTREDIPFYYSLADAFTVCDQAFCSSLTGTTPNRLHLWTGTIRDEQHASARPRVRNQDTDYGQWAAYTSFPERLEDNGISWKIYQNEIGLDLALDEEGDAWLCNFQDNPIEWFSPYHVRYSAFYRNAIPEKIASLTTQISTMKTKLAGLQAGGKAVPLGGKEGEELKEHIAAAEKTVQTLKEDQQTFTQENYDKLPQREKNLHERAFSTNSEDPFYHELSHVSYHDGDTVREMKVPKGDVLHQFREDVKSGKLPAVSWLVAPERFSDHPSSAWYGPWYISEALDILTANPEVWKKTIFVLCYDENDGYFDHVPPFVSPHPDQPETGLASEGIDLSLEHMSREQDLQKMPETHARGGPIGLGYRVPLVVASPWSRGGFVNSQVFDHTSILMFLEKFLSYKYGKKIEESNINNWRRTVCGDLSSVFRPYNGDKGTVPFPGKAVFLETIYNARFKNPPAGFEPLTREQLERSRKDLFTAGLLPEQEKGVRPSCALPYELYVEADITGDHRSVLIDMRAENTAFGNRSAGSPFTVYCYGKEFKTRNYAVKPGDQVLDKIPLDDFENGHYKVHVHGPNGFFRVFAGNKQDPPVIFKFEYEFSHDQKPTGRIHLGIINTDNSHSCTVRIRDNAYGSAERVRTLGTVTKEEGRSKIILDTANSDGWYDYNILVEGALSFEKRYAGRVETGKDSSSDPAMG